MINDLWVEQYRPKTIEDCILPDHLKEMFTEIVKTGEVPNLLFTGTAGLGKTTVARALCEELGLDYFKERVLEVLRKNTIFNCLRTIFFAP